MWVLSPRPWGKHKRKGRNSGDFHLPCEELFLILTSNRMRIATEDAEVSLSNHRTSRFWIQVAVRLLFQGHVCNFFAKLYKTPSTWPWKISGICLSLIFLWYWRHTDFIISWLHVSPCPWKLSRGVPQLHTSLRKQIDLNFTLFWAATYSRDIKHITLILWFFSLSKQPVNLEHCSLQRVEPVNAPPDFYSRLISPEAPTDLRPQSFFVLMLGKLQRLLNIPERLERGLWPLTSALHKESVGAVIKILIRLLMRHLLKDKFSRRKLEGAAGEGSNNYRHFTEVTAYLLSGTHHFLFWSLVRASSC